MDAGVKVSSDLQWVLDAMSYALLRIRCVHIAMFIYTYVYACIVACLHYV